MKKIYKAPLAKNETFEFADEITAPTLPVSGDADSGTVVDAKHRGFTVEDEEEEEAILHLMVDRENGNTNDLW
ncbi:MAG: hypothetical protein ACI3YI_01255 [Bacteroidaceae bacterium]